MNSTRRTRRTRRMVARLTAAAGLALAMSAANAQITWHVDSTSTAGAAQGASDDQNTRSRTVIEQRTDGDSIRITIENDRVTGATINGRTIPPSRVRRVGQAVEILDGSGRVDRVIAIRRAPTPPPPAVGVASPSAPRVPDVPAFPGEVERPPVMLGVTMTEAGEGIRRQLGLGDVNVVQISSVIEGLPAARAGLEQYDLLLAIDGERGVTQAGVTEALKRRQPGDVMRLTVLRAGAERQIEVRLEPFDAQRLMPAVITSPAAAGAPVPPLSSDGPRTIGGAAGIQGFFESPDGLARVERLRSLVDDGTDAARRSMESALAALDEARANLSGQERAAMEAARARLQESIARLAQEAAEQAAADARSSIWALPRGGGGTFVLDNNRLIRVPQAGGQAGGQSGGLGVGQGGASRMGDLERRVADLEAVNERLERTVDRLETLLDRLERRP